MKSRRLIVLAWVLATASCKGQGSSSSAEAPPAVTPAPSIPAPAPAPADASSAPISDPDTKLPVPPDVATPPPDGQKTAKGVVMTVLQKGTGTAHPGPTDYVEVKYAGWTRAGELFESSGYEPLRLDMAQIIPGLADSLALMVEGEKRRLWIPSAQAYGPRLNHVNAPRGDMTFDVELLLIVKKPVAPADLRNPPKDAKATKSGLTYRVMKKGMGKKRPTLSSRVLVRYALWTPEGRMLENSHMLLGSAAPVRLERLMDGWSQGLQLMVEGDVLRLWIPGKLAHGEIVPGQEQPPFLPQRGPLVMDLELIKFLAKPAE